MITRYLLCFIITRSFILLRAAVKYSLAFLP
jgi:hypothetical protein